MLSEKQHIDDFFRRKEEAFTPGDQQLDAHWQQMRMQLTDPEPTPHNAKAGSNISGYFNKFLGGLITVIIIAVLAINPFRSHKKSISKTKQATTTVAVTTNEAVKKSWPSDPLTNTTINAPRPKAEHVNIATSVDYGLDPEANLPIPPPDKEKPDAYALLQAFYKELEKPEQEFYIQNDRDTTLIANEGTRLFVPAGILLANATPVKGPIKIVIREYYRNEDIIAARLHTLSNGQLLETGGMLYISAEQDGQPVMIAPQKAITVNMPTDKYDSQMQLFTGRETPSDEESSSALNWIPVGLFQPWGHENSHRIKALNLHEVEPFSVSYGRKTIARFYVSEQVLTPRPQLMAQLKQRFGTYYDVIKFKRAHKNKNYGESASGNPFVIDSTYIDVNKVLASKKLTQKDRQMYDTLLKRDSFNLKKQEKFSSTYSFLLTSFGWYNCDKVKNDPQPRVAITADFGKGSDANQYVSLLVFTRFRSVVAGEKRGGHKAYYQNVPADEPAILITVTIANEQVMSNMQAITTSNMTVSDLLFEPTTPAQFKQKLQSLFASQQ